MLEQIYSLLTAYGLRDKEIKIFLFLVGKKELTGYKIAKELRLFRSTTYDILDRLIEKGFAEKSLINKKIYYHANEIGTVISNLKTKEETLVSLTPLLSKIGENRAPQVRILEGEIGEKQFNFDLMRLIKEKQINEILIIGNEPPAKVSSYLFVEKIIKEVEKLKPKKYGTYRGILAAKYKNTKFAKLYNKFGKNKFLEGLPSQTTTIIFGDFVEGKTEEVDFYQQVGVKK